MAENKSAATVSTYLEAVRQLGAFLQSREMPTDPTGVDDDTILSRLLAINLERASA